MPCSEFPMRNWLLGSAVCRTVPHRRRASGSRWSRRNGGLARNQSHLQPATLCEMIVRQMTSAPPIRQRSRLWRSIQQQPLAAVGILLLAGFVACAVFAPWLAPQDPAQLDLGGRLLAPGHGHWFGTDELGRDILSRTLFGARISLEVAVSVVSLSLYIGLIAGALAGFYGGWIDTGINVYVTNAFMALPGILLAIAFVAFLGPGLFNLILALSISGWVGYARLVRAQVMAVKEREYVEAARALGASDLRIFARHILPNIVQPLIVQAAIGMA